MFFGGEDHLAVTDSHFCFQGTLVSALHCAVGGYRTVDMYSLVHTVETHFYYHFSLQCGMELGVSI